MEFNAVIAEPISDETRTAIDEANDYGSAVGVLWCPNETIGVYNDYFKNVKFTSTNTSNNANATFRGIMLGTPKYAYYPYNSENTKAAYTQVKGNIPLYQSYSNVHKTLDADYKVGVLDESRLFGATFEFTRLVCLWKFQVNATGSPLEGQILRSISVKVSNQRQISGDFTMNLKEQTFSLGEFKENADSLYLRMGGSLVMNNGTSHVAYATCLPVVKSGDEYQITITTDTHIAKLSRTSKAAHKSNGLYKFTLNLSDYELDITEIPQPDDPGFVPTHGADTYISRLSFTVADNPGKILGRKFTHNSSFSVSVSNVSEEVCEIDNENYKITLSVPYLNNRKLVPTFDIPEGTTLLYEGGEVISGETEIDFSVFKQLAVVNSNNEMAIYDVELTNTGLPVVVINQATGVTSTESDSEYSKASAAWYKATGAKWQPKESDWEMTEGIDNFMIYNADGTPALADKNGAIVEAPVLASTRVRGNVTQQMPKKPFAVKLDKKHAITITNADGTKSVMPAHKRWVLLANWKDRTLMRNAVAFGIADVFKQTFPNDGMAWNPSGEFVELVYNGVHVGTYYLCEQIKIDGNRLDINEPLDEKDNPYNGDPSVFGYLLESDDAYDETWKFTTACYVPFLFKDDGNSEMLTYAQNFVRGIEDNLYKNTTAGYEAAYANMDLTSFVDFWLIQELMMNSETKHPKSCHSYINNGKMYAGPIWDFDWNTLPTSSSYSEEGYSYTTSMLSKAKASHKSSGYPTEPIVGGGWLSSEDKNYLWYPMLVKDATFKNLAAERWNAVKGAIQTYVNTEIPKIEAKIAASEAINNAMWPVDSGSGSIGTKRYSTYGIGGGFCGDEGKSFSDAVDAMQSTLTSRINGMSFVSNKSWPTVSYSRK